MEQSHYEDQLSRAKRYQRWWVLVCVVLLLVNGLLGVTVCRLAHQQTAWLIPMNLRNPTAVSTEGYSANYLATVAEAFASLRLDFTPATIKTNQRLLAEFLAPESYAALTQTLATEAKQVQHQGISSSFAVTARHMDVANQAVRLTGVLTRFVGEKRLPPVTVTFQLTFTRHNGLIQLHSFEEVQSR